MTTKPKLFFEQFAWFLGFCQPIWLGSSTSLVSWLPAAGYHVSVVEVDGFQIDEDSNLGVVLDDGDDRYEVGLAIVMEFYNNNNNE